MVVLRRRECSLNTLGIRKFDLLSIFKVMFWFLIKTQKGGLIKFGILNCNYFYLIFTYFFISHILDLYLSIPFSTEMRWVLSKILESSFSLYQWQTRN